jgi:peptidyl-prolyl cis-trans isomerase A (cyclophilin A)
MGRIHGALIMAGLLALPLAAQTQSTTKSGQHRSTGATHRTTSGVKRSLLKPETLNEKAPETYKVKVTTTKGDFVIEAHRDWAPLGADRFYNLVKNGYYTNASFFRVLPGFVVQWGFHQDPAVNRVWEAARLQDDPVTQSNTAGTLTFATAGPNTRTTQIFINLADNARLDVMGFSPFAKVIEGMDVVEKFYSGYGEGAPQGNGPDQGQIASGGKAYLEKNFPQLDSIKVAVIEPAPTAAKPASTAAKPASATHKPVTTTAKENK